MHMGESDWGELISKTLSSGVDAWGKISIAKSQADIAKAQAKAQAQNPFGAMFGYTGIAGGGLPGAGQFPYTYQRTGAGGLDGGNTTAYILAGGAALLGVMLLMSGSKRR